MRYKINKIAASALLGLSHLCYSFAAGLSHEMQIYITLNDVCSNLEASEVALMLSDVRANLADENCHMDTSGIVRARDQTAAPAEVTVLGHTQSRRRFQSFAEKPAAL